MVQPTDYTATLTGITDANGRRAFSVVYANASSKVERQYVVDVISDQLIAQTAVAEIRQLSAVTKAPPLTVQVGEVIDLSLADPPPPAPPTPEQIAESQYRQDRSTLDTLLASQAAGMPVDVQALKSLEATTVDEYRPEYDS